MIISNFACKMVVDGLYDTAIYLKSRVDHKVDAIIAVFNVIKGIARKDPKKSVPLNL